jgi:hypothetical protein
VYPTFKQGALAPAHQQGSSTIQSVLVIAAVLGLTATGLGAAREVGLIRRRA